MAAVLLLQHDGQGLCQVDPVHLDDGQQGLTFGVPLLQHSMGDVSVSLSIDQHLSQSVILGTLCLDVRSVKLSPNYCFCQPTSSMSMFDLVTGFLYVNRWLS